VNERQPLRVFVELVSIGEFQQCGELRGGLSSEREIIAGGLCLRCGRSSRGSDCDREEKFREVAHGVAGTA
jgi:hypothetical protein